MKESNTTDYHERYEKVKNKVDVLQDEYFTLLFDMINHTEGLIAKKRGYNYYWERLKDLQSTINTFSNLGREISFDIAKDALERAFNSPKVQEIMKKSKWNDTDEKYNNLIDEPYEREDEVGEFGDE